MTEFEFQFTFAICIIHQETFISCGSVCGYYCWHTGVLPINLVLCLTFTSKSNRTLFDKAGKTFSVADEFVIHAFKAHLIAAACAHFNVKSPSETIPHDQTQEWLISTAKCIVETSVLPKPHKDQLHDLHSSFLYAGFLYADLRNALKFEGDQIIRLWKHWLIYFLGTNRKNYANEALNLLCNLKATFPRHIAYIATHNRTVNTSGKAGHGKPTDQMLEHYNL